MNVTAHEAGQCAHGEIKLEGTLIPGPPKVLHTSRSPQFSRPSTKTQTKGLCTNSLSIVHKGFCPGVMSEGLLSGRLCPVWFLSIPRSVRIHLLRQKIKHHFKFQVSFV